MNPSLKYKSNHCEVKSVSAEISSQISVWVLVSRSCVGCCRVCLVECTWWDERATIIYIVFG
jgi:hypothetical protein